MPGSHGWVQSLRQDIHTDLSAPFYPVVWGGAHVHHVIAPCLKWRLCELCHLIATISRGLSLTTRGLSIVSTTFNAESLWDQYTGVTGWVVRGQESNTQDQMNAMHRHFKLASPSSSSPPFSYTSLPYPLPLFLFLLPFLSFCSDRVLVCRSVWPRTHSRTPTSRVLRSQVFASTPC